MSLKYYYYSVNIHLDQIQVNMHCMCIWCKDEDTRAFIAMVHLTCAKHRVRLTAAQRKVFGPTLNDSSESLMMTVQVVFI